MPYFLNETHNVDVRFSLIIFNITNVMAKVNCAKKIDPKVKPLPVRGFWVESKMLDYVIMSFSPQAHIKF